MNNVSKKRRETEVLERQLNKGVILESYESHQEGKEMVFISGYMSAMWSLKLVIPLGIRGRWEFLTTFAFQEHKAQVKFNVVTRMIK